VEQHARGANCFAREEKEQTERSIFGEVAVDADKSEHGSIATIADSDAQPLPQPQRTDAQNNKKIASSAE
jgi:hypothetical protein